MCVFSAIYFYDLIAANKICKIIVDAKKPLFKYSKKFYRD